MMFTKLSTVLLSLAVLAVATPNPWGQNTPPPTTTTKPPVTTTVTVTQTATQTVGADQCNTGSIQCCNTVTTAGSAGAQAILGLLGVVVSDLEAAVGLDCDPISVIGLGSNSCEQDPVCCENDSFSGLIVIGCSPININL